MTTERQKASNRENARRSTGPRGAAGKAITARNAVRHGATRRPDGERILGYYRMILNDPKAAAQDSLADPVRRSAWRLAEAEVRLLLARASYDTFQREPPLTSTLAGGKLAFEKLLQEAKADAASAAERQFVDAATKFVAEVTRREETERERRSRLLLRYLSHAESRRLSALRQWRRANG
jgi:hypothetical protein